MNRYHILIGKDPPTETYLAGLDIGKGDSTSVIAQFVRCRTGAAPVSSLPPVYSATVPQFITEVPVYNDEHFQMGDMVGTDERGMVCKIKEGLIPIGVVERPPVSNDTIIMRDLTVSEQVSADLSSRRFSRMMMAMNSSRFNRVHENEIASHLGKLHEHPHMQREKSIPPDHVIVDKADWLEARRGISSEQI